jgi:hypothetical protein
MLERQKFDNWFNANSKKMKVAVKKDLLFTINLNDNKSKEK